MKSFVVTIILILLVYSCQGAVVAIDSKLTGTSGVLSTTSAQWATSNANLSNIPLTSGQEYISGSMMNSYLASRGNIKISNTIDNTNLGIASGDSSFTYSRGGAFSETASIDSYGSNDTGTLCAPDNTYPYHDSVEKHVIGIGSQGGYGSYKTITQGGDLDTLEFNHLAEGSDGIVSSNTYIYSQSGLDENSSSLNYANDIYNHELSSGGSFYNMTGNLSFSSFKNTFDSSLNQGEELNYISPLGE